MSLQAKQEQQQSSSSGVVVLLGQMERLILQRTLCAQSIYKAPLKTFLPL